MISMKKWLSARHLFSETMMPVYLIVRFTDATMCVVLSDVSDPDICYCGRRDRQDVQDMEPVIYIPMGKFVPVEKTTWPF